MKKFGRLAALMAAILMIILPARVKAEEWSEEYYRIINYAEAISDEDRDFLDEKCIEIVSTYHMDAAGVIAKSSDYAFRTMEKLGDKEYKECGFGYGADKDGIMVVYDIEKQEMCINRYGKAVEVIDDAFANVIAEKALEKYDEKGAWAVMYFPFAVFENALEAYENGADLSSNPAFVDETEQSVEDRQVDAPKTVENPDASENADEADPVDFSTNDSVMPDWYPEDPTTFERFHNDASIARVVDDADLFTKEEEAVMSKMIESIRTAYSKDIVIYTSNTSFGLGETRLAMDYYEFNGYGIGDQYEGICLCIVMDPNDRGFAVSAGGDDTRALYTESNAGDMDRRLLNFMKDKEDSNGNVLPGDYGLGVINWIENAEKMFETGHAIVPTWYEDMRNHPDNYYDSDGPRVTTDGGILTEEQIAEFEKRCRALSEQTGVDVVMHFTYGSYWMSDAEYVETLYKAKGYGIGDAHSGIAFYVKCIAGAYNREPDIVVFGNRMAKLSDTNLKRLQRKTLVSEDTYEVGNQYLNDLEHMVRTGRVTRTKAYWIWTSILWIIIGSTIAGALTKVQDKKMKKPHFRMDAAEYLVPGTLSVVNLGDKYLRKNVKTIYSPLKDDSSSSSTRSSSSGGSHYSSSSTSSSGRSYTTSGSKF